MNERIAVIDFGGQYNQLIVRRIRELGVYSELLPPGATLEQIRGQALSGIVLTGGPDSVYAQNAREACDELFSLGVPVLGICYGMQYIAKKFNGKIDRAGTPEYGKTIVNFFTHPLFSGVTSDIVWMSHNDSVVEAPAGFSVVAKTENCPVAAFADDARRIYGIQFHAEVTHTVDGKLILENFLNNICHLKREWKMENMIDSLTQQMREQIGDSSVLAALSGGVDSTVAAVLVHRAIGNRLTCIFVDHGLLRENEAEQVMDTYRRTLGLNVIKVDAKDEFMSKLSGVSEPERKRKIIGEEFIRVLEREARKLVGMDYMLQGTIYPDVIESGMGGSAKIKSHHNVGGLPDRIDFKGIIEPLRLLFKDEVRALGTALGIPDELIWRQPFPGPGLAIRVMGEITESRLEIVRKSDAILREEVKKAGLERELWQYFTVFTGVQNVGVMGDERTYDYVVAVRAIKTEDFMTCEWARLPYELLEVVSERIVAEVPHVNRVVYDITGKPPATVEWE